MKIFKNLKNVSILFKIIIPLVVINLFSFLAFVIFFGTLSGNGIERRLKDGLELINSEIDLSYNIIREKSLMTATALSYNPTVIEAYETYFRTKDLDSSTLLLDKNIQQIVSSLEKSFNQQIRIHFHARDNNTIFSFYRSWVSRKGDDLSSYRNSLNELYLVEKPVSGIEVDRGGFVIRGIHPIYIDESIVLGSVEVYFPITDLMANIIHKENESSAVLVLKSTIELFMKEELEGELTTVTDDFILTDNNSNNVNLELLSNDTLLNALNKPTYLRIGEYGYLLKPVLNFQNKPEGLIVYQMSLTDIIVHFRKIETIVGIIIGGFFILTIILMIVITNNAVSKPINQIIKILEGLSKGEHNRRMRIKSTDEAGRIKKAINHLNENLINIEDFAHQIGEGQFSTTFRPRSKKDTLAFTLISMKEKLQRAKEETEARRDEEKKREWQTEGVRVIYDILRKFSQSGDELFYQVIATLVKYIGANQGGIFLLDISEEILELKGCYAYDRNKYFNKKVSVKEGLIGRCFQEKEYLNITNLPDSYLKIVSGVGEKSPDNLLLVPLLHDEEVKGVIELASFNKFEDHVVEYVQEITRQLSSALNDIEYSEKTKRLLEESKDKEQKLVQQEEEMRQNLEELKATQEQLERRQEQIEVISKELEDEKISLREFLKRIKKL